MFCRQNISKTKTKIFWKVHQRENDARSSVNFVYITANMAVILNPSDNGILTEKNSVSASCFLAITDATKDVAQTIKQKQSEF